MTLLPLRGVRILLRFPGIASGIVAHCKRFLLSADTLATACVGSSGSDGCECEQDGSPAMAALALRKDLYIITVTVYMHRITPCVS